jgi:hypothetical protein
MSTTQNPEEVRKCHARWRRIADHMWLGLTLLLAVGGAIVWLSTGNIQHLYSGLFYATVPLIGLLHNHFILLNPRRDSLETQQRLEYLHQRQREGARTVAVVNGAILLIASPVLIIVGVCAGAQYGVMGEVIGGIIGSVWLVGGLVLVAWGQRSRPRD